MGGEYSNEGLGVGEGRRDPGREEGDRTGKSWERERPCTHHQSLQVAPPFGGLVRPGHVS